MSTIPVKMPNQRYDVVIEDGLLKTLGERVRQVWSPRKVAIITDDNVGPLYLDQVTNELTESGFTVVTAVVPHGEHSKSLAQLEELAQQLAAASFNRTDSLLALGGGVVGDLTGLLASVYMRGIDFIQVPTSLLAQVDSSVGGKTAVDVAQVKNLLGTFYQPDLVLIDPQTLKTLPQRDLVEGYGEVVKAGALVGGDFWSLILQINSPATILQEAAKLIHFALEFKVQVTSQDEREGGQRQLLNFGHTIGHGVESLANGDLRHGEAVSLGLIAISTIFADQDETHEVLEKLRDRLEVVGLPVTSPLLADDGLMDKIKNDKKNRHGYLNVVYLTAIGQPKIEKISLTDLAAKINRADFS